MSQTRYTFDDKGPFIEKLKELVDGGLRSEQMEVVVPFPMHELDHLLKLKKSKLRYFTLVGALSGFFSGLALTLGTVADWPLITGGKPLMSVTAFLVIAFELTILFGAIASFVGFLILARLPVPHRILDPVEHDNQFTIVVHQGERS